MARMQPTLTAVLLGAGDGYLRKTDVDKGRTTLAKQWGTWAEAIAAGSGIIADLMRLGISREVTDAASISGFALLSERLTRSALSGSFGTGAPMSIAGRSYAPMAANGYASAAPFATKEYSPTVI